MRKPLVLASLLLFGAAGCADLDVTNPNQPETERVLATAEDVESLIAGAYGTWWDIPSWYNSLHPILSAASFQHSPMAANFGMIDYSAIPRRAVGNDPAHGFYNHFANPWGYAYGAIAAARDGLIALERPDVTLGSAGDHRARTFAKFMQGLSHGYLALLYDQAFILDETVDPLEIEMQPREAVRDAALGYFAEAIDLINQGPAFTIPASWMSMETSSDRLARLAHSYSARILAQYARTPEERQNVDWDAVIAHAQAGITSDFNMAIAADFEDWTMVYVTFPGAWSQVNNMILGMADQSGRYQAWLDTPIGDRQPFLYQTPDERFPQGGSQEEQLANPGMYYTVPGGAGEAASVGGQWVRSDRGTWRWSFYRDYRHDSFHAAGWEGQNPEITVREMRLLEAEGHYRLNRAGDAAAIVNETRVAHGGLNPTNANGTNTSCVPRLPDNTCGGLLEMIKWEKRVENYHVGLGNWYFDSRGWGDLYPGTFLQLPVPARELQIMELPVYTFGGGGDWSAGESTYGF